MARGAALNPASMPFFPGGFLHSEEEGSDGSGFGHHISREQDRTSSSSLSISPSDYRSMRSSPSPPQEDRIGERSIRYQPSPAPEERTRSPSFRHVDAGKAYPLIEARTREQSMLGSLDTLPEDDDAPAPNSVDNVPHPLGRSSPFFSPTNSHGRERIMTPPVPGHSNGSSKSPYNAGPFSSSSPVSSLDSASQFVPSYDQPLSFEAQLKASPLIRDILDQLARCESSTRDIQRDLSEVHRKVNLMVDRTCGPAAQGIPEFHDPFAAPNPHGPNVNASNGPRASIIGGIAPHQSGPPDDMTQITQRLTTLTSSVGQLLALQTQQHMHTNTPGLPNTMVGAMPHPGDIAPNQLVSPTSAAPGMLGGHGLPNRPDLRPAPRVPNPPMRTWSVGALDLPPRPADASNALNRQEALLRDKRRSVTGLMRRDSVGVRPAAF
jgi:hypothetical protein